MQLEPILDPPPAPELAAAEEPVEAGPDGPVAKLRAQRQRLEAQRTQEFDLPGYTGFYARYRRLRIEDTQQILNDPEAPTVEKHAQLLIDACEELFLRDDAGDHHVSDGFDDDLADKLDIKVNEAAEMGAARQVVLGVFDGNEHVLCQHARGVYAWMNMLRNEDEDRLLGELTGTPTSR